MRQQVSIAEARNNLSKLVRAAEQGEPIELTRRGQPVVVLVSADEFRRLTEQPRTSLAQAVREVRARYKIDGSDSDPDTLFPRDPSPGRDFRYED